MQEAAYPTLNIAASCRFDTGKVPPRQGNASHGRVPPQRLSDECRLCRDESRFEAHWHNLLSAMGAEELRDDPRLADNAARVAHRAEVDAAGRDLDAERSARWR